MTTVAQDICDFIIDYDSNYEPINYVNSMPANIHECFCVYDDGGIESDRVFNDQGNIENKTIKIIVRSKDSNTAYNTLQTIQNIIEHNVVNTNINDNYYLLIFHITDIVNLGQDSKGRYEFACRYRVKKQIWI